MQQLNCFVAGFGRVDGDNIYGAGSDFLKSIHVNIINDKICKSAWYEFDESVEFCAGEFKKLYFYFF